ncbi:hypothetical protein [Streptomyces sp. NPDC048442]|uniref:hypothetical protein n=1 Tax=Streptomyces sp. NPDC048442 TaxID=3154823 RepID=UPI0034216E22
MIHRPTAGGLARRTPSDETPLPRASSQSALTPSHWLALAHPSPARAHGEWRTHRVAMLPLGQRFDTVRIPAAVLYAALHDVRPAAVSPLLEQVLDGPVIQDAERWFYPLVPVSGAVRWQSRAATYVGEGWLGVPEIHQVPPPGAYWVVPMREPGHLCDQTRVAELVAVGSARLSGASS